MVPPPPSVWRLSMGNLVTAFCPAFYGTTGMSGYIVASEALPPEFRPFEDAQCIGVPIYNGGSTVSSTPGIIYPESNGNILLAPNYNSGWFASGILAGLGYDTCVSWVTD